MTKSLLRLVGIAAAAGVLGVVSGIVPIKASSGHWPVTKWFLNFAKIRSVATHSFGIDTPELDRPDQVVRGATHYETGCSPCHGDPELKYPVIAQKTTPRPPYLPLTLPRWDEAELFYIVKHGVKFTGMPAWPSQERDDEVWSMVAFLRKFANMDATEYRRLAQGEAQTENYNVPLEMLQESAASGVIQICRRCHGFDGLGREGAFPRLAGQHSAYLQASLRAFASGERHSGIMQPVAAALDPAAMDAIAAFYGSLPKPQAIATGHSILIAKGQMIAEQGIPERFVPACLSCHEPNSLPGNPRFPILSGQVPDFLVLQLELFKQGKRGGSDHAHLMQPIASRLRMEEMRAVAEYFGSRTADDLAP